VAIQNKLVSYVCLCMAFILCIGCSLDKSHYTYVPGRMIDSFVRPLPVTVCINALDDLRGNENGDNVGLILLPAVPYIRTHYERPEKDIKFTIKGFKPSEDFAKALQVELKRNNLFSYVRLGQDGGCKDADLVVTGKINKASVDTITTLYGMSLLGVFPTVLGLPQGKVYNTLNIQYEMRRTIDGVLVWTSDISGSWGGVFGIWYSNSNDEPYAGINLILSSGLHNELSKLAENIRKDPQRYWEH